MKILFLENPFNPSMTKDSILNFQVMDKIIRNFSILYLGWRNYYNFNNCYYGISLFTIIPIWAEECYQCKTYEATLALVS